VAHRSSSTVDIVAAKLLVLLPVSVVIVVVVVVILSVGFWPSPLTLLLLLLLLLLSLSLARTSLASMNSTKQLHKITTNSNVDLLDDDDDDHSFLYATLLVMVMEKLMMMMTLSVWLFVVPLGSFPSHLHTVALWKTLGRLTRHVQ
jgi:hypothetical protein